MDIDDKGPFKRSFLLEVKKGWPGANFGSYSGDNVWGENPATPEADEFSLLTPSVEDRFPVLGAVLASFRETTADVIAKFSFFYVKSSNTPVEIDVTVKDGDNNFWPVKELVELLNETFPYIRFKIIVSYDKETKHPDNSHSY